MAMPGLYNPQDNHQGMYAARVQDFAAEGLRSLWKPAHEDQNNRRVALVLVDVQYDFVNPNGYLPVANAEADLQRTVEFIYTHGEHITSIYASLDTHNLYQIFFPSWWMYADDHTHPNPYTRIMLSSKAELVDQDGRRVLALVDPLWTRNYVAKLKAQANLDLMIWPYHCIEGTQGRSLMPTLTEALAFHSAARNSQVTYITKGTSPTSEHYGIWAAEVQDPRDPATALNTTILDAVGDHDLIYIAGQAKSHCVLATKRQTIARFANQPDVIARLRFLTDCTSSVVHPVIDFDAMANAAEADMVRQGVVLVTSTDPIG